MADDEHARQERADSLHEEVDALKSGRRKHQPSSPREFTDEQAREQEDAQAAEEAQGDQETP